MRCTGITKDGTRCERECGEGDKCHHHRIRDLPEELVFRDLPLELVANVFRHMPSSKQFYELAQHSKDARKAYIELGRDLVKRFLENLHPDGDSYRDELVDLLNHGYRELNDYADVQKMVAMVFFLSVPSTRYRPGNISPSLYNEVYRYVIPQFSSQISAHDRNALNNIAAKPLMLNDTHHNLKGQMVKDLHNYLKRNPNPTMYQKVFFLIQLIHYHGGEPSLDGGLSHDRIESSRHSKLKDIGRRLHGSSLGKIYPKGFLGL